MATGALPAKKVRIRRGLAGMRSLWGSGDPPAKREIGLKTIEVG